MAGGEADRRAVSAGRGQVAKHQPRTRDEDRPPPRFFRQAEVPADATIATAQRVGGARRATRLARWQRERSFMRRQAAGRARAACRRDDQ